MVEGISPDKIIEDYDSHQKQVQQDAADAFGWFRKHQGEVFPRGEAADALRDRFGWSEVRSHNALRSLTDDTLDPVQQLPSPEGKRYVGIIDYESFDDRGGYGYVSHDDVAGKRRTVVCAKCVEEASTDSEPFRAVAGVTSYADSDEVIPQDAGYDPLLERLTGHYADAHGTRPEKVKVGASLASGTTISGNTAFHAGNDGPGSGLDADSLEGNEPDELGTSTSQIQEDSLIHSDGFAPGFGG